MSSRVYATGHITDPVPLVEKSRVSCPGGRFPSFIHQVITRPKKLTSFTHSLTHPLTHSHSGHLCSVYIDLVLANRDNSERLGPKEIKICLAYKLNENDTKCLRANGDGYIVNSLFCGCCKIYSWALHFAVCCNFGYGFGIRRPFKESDIVNPPSVIVVDIVTRLLYREKTLRDVIIFDVV